MDQIVALTVPFGSAVISQRLTTFRDAPTWRISKEWFLDEDVLLWAREQLGYELPKQLVRIRNFEGDMESHFVIHFKSERDAILFKTFWC